MLLPHASLSTALLATAISKSVPAFAAPRTVKELFDVSFDSSVGGNCARWGEARLNNMVSDAFDLTEAGLSAVEAATDVDDGLHNEAYRLLAAWFLTPALSTDQYNRIRGMLFETSSKKNPQV
jgi:hypothetical protein